MSIDPLIRHFQVPPADTRRKDPKRELPVAPAGGRVFLTRQVARSAEQGNVVGTDPDTITPRGPNQFNGFQQVGMETAGGSSTLGMSVPGDPDYGTINAELRSDWRVILQGPQLIQFSVEGSQDSPGVLTRRNAFVARSWWVHVGIRLNGFMPTWQAGIYWPDGTPPEIDIALPIWRGTFLIEQLGLGEPLEITLWTGRGFAQETAA